MTTKPLHRVSLNDNFNTQIFTRLPKSKHKALINKYNKHIANPVNYSSSFQETHILDQFAALANGIIISY